MGWTRPAIEPDTTLGMFVEIIAAIGMLPLVIFMSVLDSKGYLKESFWAEADCFYRSRAP